MDLLSRADSIMEQSPDSALSILQSIADTTKFNKAQRAYYLLLLTQAEYKCDTVQTVDTLLDYSINHYRKAANESLLARSLYYRGMTLFYRGKSDIAITYLCEGVDIAKQLNDELQLSKYYESLFQVNFEARYYKKSLDYARKFLDNSIERNDTDCIVRAYSHVSTNYSYLNIIDSILCYLQYSLPLLNSVNIQTQTATLTNIGITYYKKQEYDSAKIYLHKSLNIKPRYNTNKVLGDVYYKEGNTALATDYWNKSLATPNPKLRISTLKSIYEQVLNCHDYERAHALLYKIKHLEDSLKHSLKTKEIAKLQYEYEVSKKDKEYYKKMSKLYLILFLLSIIIFSVPLLLYVYRCKIKKHIEEIKRQHEQIKNDMNRQLEKTKNQIIKQSRDIKEIGKENEKAIKEKELKALKHDENLRIGNNIFDKIRNGEPMPVNIPRADICLVEYFRTIYPETCSIWDKEYEKLTNRQTVYLILKYLQYEDSQIKETLQYSDNALRTLKSRFNKAKEK